MAKWLTKSDYLKFLIHPAYLWLAKYAKDELPEFNEVAQANVDQGNAVEAVAVSLWPGGHEVDVPMFDGPDESARQMRDGGPDVLFQPSVLTDRRLYVRSDVMGTTRVDLGSVRDQGCRLGENRPFARSGLPALRLGRSGL